MDDLRWHLATVEHAGSRSAALVVRGDADGIVHRPAFLTTYGDALDVIRAWPQVSPLLREWRPAATDRVQDARLLQPLQYPRKVLCSGPNYSDHLAEMGEAGLGESWTAYFFLKPPTTTLVGDGEPVLVDDPERDRVDWEGELAAVVGVGGRRIPPEQALSHVAGYLVANDVSLRGPHRRDTPAKPFQWDWLASKGADTSLPIGPGVVPSWQVPDPQALAVTTRVNGETRQKGTTADMVLDVAHLVADASRLVTLEPGDVILTGTPAGVGAARGTFLADGDEVEVSIEGVGTIRNRVVRRPASTPDRTAS